MIDQSIWIFLYIPCISFYAYQFHEVACEASILIHATITLDLFVRFQVLKFMINYYKQPR